MIHVTKILFLWVKARPDAVYCNVANDFFKLTFSNLPITPRDLNNNINTMATVVYNYFSENFGYVNNHNDSLKIKSRAQQITLKPNIIKVKILIS